LKKLGIYQSTTAIIRKQRGKDLIALMIFFPKRNLLNQTKEMAEEEEIMIVTGEKTLNMKL
jgi:hypothetical protein